MHIKQTLKNIIAPNRKIYTEKKKCRCCGSNKLQEYADLGKQCLANNLTSKKRVPLKMVKCDVCNNSQLSVVVDPKEMFDDYLFVSGTAQSHIDHFAELAKYAFNISYNEILRPQYQNESYHDLDPNLVNVLDIACNNGTLLDEFVKLGCTVHGVDPAKNLRKYTKAKKIPVDVKYWDEKIATKHKNKFDIITAVNVFAHVDDSLDFLENCKIALKEDGIIVIEFPYNLNLIFQRQFDTVYHEHLNYFLVDSFEVLLSRAGLTIRNVSLNDSYGGSIRFVLQQYKAGMNLSETAKALIKIEEQIGLHSIETYKKSFSEFNATQSNVESYLVHLMALDAQQQKADNVFIGYGAGAKTTVYLNTDRFQNEMIPLSVIIDDNPLKCGHKVPGTKIPIKDTTYLKEFIDDVENVNKVFNIVIFSWNFYDEIKQKIATIFGDRKYRLIKYVPDFQVETHNTDKTST